MASPPSVAVGLGWTLRSEGRSMAPLRMAKRRTSGVAPKATLALTAKTIRYEITGFPGPKSCLPSRVGRESRDELGDPSSGDLLDPFVLRRSQHRADDAGDLLHLGFVHAERGRPGRPHPDAARLERRQWIERDGVLVDRNTHFVAR